MRIYYHSCQPGAGIDALFDYDIEGDAGDDPNFMTLWLSQANLGLPSKVHLNPVWVALTY